METISVFFIGAVFGSFVNATAYRTVRNKNFIFERSNCPVCGKQLSFLDMVPVVSYLLKKGKCRYCQNRIARRYLFTEILGGINGTVCWHMAEVLEAKILFFFILNFLLFMALIDIEIMEIKDIYQLLLLILAAVTISIEKWSINNLIGALIISLPLLVLATVTESIGGADVKVFFILGMLAKEKGIMVIYLLTIGLASVFALYRLQKGSNRKEEIPLLPFIYLAFLTYKGFEKYLLNCVILWLT